MGDVVATVKLRDSVGVSVEHCMRRGSAAKSLPEGHVPAPELATRVLLGRAEGNGPIAAALVGVSWRRWGWNESLSVEIGRRCRGRGCCSRRWLYFRDIVIKVLDFVVSDVVVYGVRNRHLRGLMWG